MEVIGFCDEGDDQQGRADRLFKALADNPASQQLQDHEALVLNASSVYASRCTDLLSQPYKK